LPERDDEGKGAIGVMDASGGGPAANGNRGGTSVSDLLLGIVDDARTIARQEVLLARQELTEGLAQAAKASGMLIAAGVVAVFAVAFLLTTLAWGLVGLGLPEWAGFGIVTLVLLLVVTVLALLGVRRLKRMNLAPARAQAELEGTVQHLRSEAQTTAGVVQAELRTTVEEARTEARNLSERLRGQTNGYTEQARAGVRRRVEEARRRRGDDVGGDRA
jgi:ABC-type multidrug transport system fused ATPase/permease subunit